MGRCPKLFFVTLTFITCLCLIESRQLTDIEVLQRTTCEAVFKKAQGNRKDIGFTNPIGNLSCKPGQNGHTRYHCMENEDGHFIQFCAEWIWIEPRLCPKLYSLQGIINPVECDKTKGCPTERYQSHEYYKYHACFNITKKNEGTTEKQGKLENPKSEGQLGGGLIALIVIGVTVSVITAIAVTVLFILWRLGIIGNRSREGDTLLPKDDEIPLIENTKQERPLKEAIDSLRAKSCILLTGLTGSGVSTLLRQIYVDGFSDYTYEERKYPTFKNPKGMQYFFVFSGEVLMKMIKKNMSERIKEATTCGHDVKKNLVVLNPGYTWFQENHDALSKMKDFDIIDISSKDLRLNEREKKHLINKRCETSGFGEDEFPEQKRNEAASFEGQHCGYPRLCDMLFQAKRFDDPVQFLNEEDLRH